MSTVPFTTNTCYDVDKIVRLITKTHKQVLIDYKMHASMEMFQTFRLFTRVDDIMEDIEDAITDYGQARLTVGGQNILHISFGDKEIKRTYEIWGLDSGMMKSVTDYVKKINASN
jgi:hypothetical protein